MNMAYHRSSVDSIASALSVKMLEGWTMLATTCPNDACAVPLMRSPGRQTTLCVNCSQTFNRDMGAAPMDRIAQSQSVTQQGSEYAGSANPRENGPILETFPRLSDDIQVASDNATTRANATTGPTIHTSTEHMEVVLRRTGPVRENGDGNGISPDVASERPAWRAMDVDSASGVHNRADNGAVSGTLTGIASPVGTQATMGTSRGALQTEGSLASGLHRGPDTEAAGGSIGNGHLNARVSHERNGAVSNPNRGRMNHGAGAANGPVDGTDGLNEASSMEEGESQQLHERRSARPDASSAIGEKLLEGWTMLDFHCPTCLAPIMRDRQRRMFCVVCNIPVITEEEAGAFRNGNAAGSLPVSQPASVEQQGGREVAQAEAPVHSPMDGQTTAGEDRGRVREVGGEAVNWESSQLAAPIMATEEFEELAGLAQTGRGEGSGPGEQPNGDDNMAEEPSAKRRAGERTAGMHLTLPEAQSMGSGSLPTVVVSTVATLTSKLEATRQLMERTQDVAQLRELFSVIAECARTISSVRSLAME